ncbi:Nuclear cap-binding protein subunit 1, partial [Teratosphaeriaceae sp. CCFEE 6253]
MADVDTRRDYGDGGSFRGGRGRGGYGNKRKRGREDDDLEQGRPDRRPRHAEAPPGTRLRRALLEIGEDPLRLPQEIALNTAKLAAANYEDDYVRDTFCTVGLKLVVEQPFKIPLLAGVVQYANTENGEVAKDILSRAAPQLQEYLDQGQWREFKLMLRFVACLSPLYEEDGVLPILDELFNRAVDLQTASQEDAVGLELVKIILLTIPYLLAHSADATLQQAASELLGRTDIIASAQSPLEPLVDPYPDSNAEEGRPMACASVISLLQGQLQNEESNGWPLSCIPRV